MSSNLPPKGMTDTQTGLLWLIGGILILLYAFNLFAQSLNFLVILGGVAMIVLGFLKLKGLERLQQFLKKKSQ